MNPNSGDTADRSPRGVALASQWGFGARPGRHRRRPRGGTGHAQVSGVGLWRDLELRARSFCSSQAAGATFDSNASRTPR